MKARTAKARDTYHCYWYAFGQCDVVDIEADTEAGAGVGARAGADTRYHRRIVVSAVDDGGVDRRRVGRSNQRGVSLRERAR